MSAGTVSGTSITSTRASESGWLALASAGALESITYPMIQRLRKFSHSARDMKLPILSRIMAFR